MAIDTTNKKLSVMEMEDVWEPSIPISSPLTQADYQQFLWGYSGVLWHSLFGSQGISLDVKAFWPLGDAYNAATFEDTTGNGNDLFPYLRINTCTEQFRIGRNSCASCGFDQQALATLKGWGKWHRLLTAGEKTALLGKEYWPFSTTTSLQDVRVYYLLDETGGSSSYADATGHGNTLTATGTTIQDPGPAGGGDKATRLTAGVYLTKASPGTDLQSTQVATTIAGWVMLSSKPSGAQAQQVFWGQLNNDTNISGFNVYYDPTCDRFAFDCDAGDGTNLSQGSLVLDANFGSPSTGVWYFLIAEFDYAGNLISVSVNNGTKTTLSPTLQPIPATGILGDGSQFQLNPTASFATATSGWDYDGTHAINGNCNLYHTANSDISFGNNQKTVWGWFKTTNTSTYQTLAGFYDYDGVTQHTDWVIQIAGNVLYFVFGKEEAYASVAFTDTADFHLVVGWFDKDNNRIHIDLDNGASANDVAGPTTPQTSPAIFRLGSDTSGGGNAHQFLGILNAWGIADGIPTQDDLDTLWNNGNGWLFPVTPLFTSFLLLGVG